MSQTLGTIRLPYRLFRDTVSTADADLTKTTKTWGSFLTNHRPVSSSGGGSGALAIKLEERDNKAIVCFDHGNEDDDGTPDTAALIIYGYREGFPAEFICSVDTITAGHQSNDANPDAGGTATTTRYFSDTIGTITQRWIGGSSSVEEVDSTAGGDGIAKLKFDTYGIKYLLILFTTISSSDDVRAWITFY